MRKLLLSTVLLLLTNSISAEENIAEKFRKLITNDELTLSLCNVDIVKAFGFKVGYTALYLEDCTKPENLFEQGRQYSTLYVRNLKASAFQKSSVNYIKKNLNIAHYERIEKPLELFNKSYENIEKGDLLEIAWTDKKGLVLIKNQKEIGQSSNLELANAYFTVWFGEKPFSKKMKERLLTPSNIQASN